MARWPAGEQAEQSARCICLSGLEESLAPIFQNRQPTFLSDSELVVDTLRASGHRAHSFSDLRHLDKDSLHKVVMIPIRYASTPRGALIEGILGHSAMLVLPIASFCGTDAGALYMLQKLSVAKFSRPGFGELGLAGSARDGTVDQSVWARHRHRCHARR